MQTNKRPSAVNWVTWLAVAAGILYSVATGTNNTADLAKLKATVAASAPAIKATPTAGASATTGASATAPLASATPAPATPTSATATAALASPTPTIAFEPSATAGPLRTPWPSAPLCDDARELHNNGLFHTLWDAARGCHYQHEHGVSPFVPAIRDAFAPLGYTLEQFLCGVQIGSCNPSSGVENTNKHSGHKWNASCELPNPGATGFEGAQVGIDCYAIQFHNYSVADIEYESRQHSSTFFVRQYVPSDPNPHGYLAFTQLQEFGQRVSPYQGSVIPYPDNPQPAYGAGFGPYFTTDCVGAGVGCRASLQFFMQRPTTNAAQKWTSKPTGQGARPETSLLGRMLFDYRDAAQVLDWASVVDGYPVDYLFICTADGGATFDQRPGCAYNNSAYAIHEIAGDVPAAWDNLSGWDSNPAAGRITADGYVSRFGMPVAQGGCSIPGMGCYHVVMVDAFVGRWGADLCNGKCSFISNANTPDLGDVYFCNGLPCRETDAGAVSSGWIGSEN